MTADKIASKDYFAICSFRMTIPSVRHFKYCVEVKHVKPCRRVKIKDCHFNFGRFSQVTQLLRNI